MNILIIASLLPIPGVIKENDYVFNLRNHYRSRYPADSFLFLRPTPLKIFRLPGIKIIKQRGSNVKLTCLDYQNENEDILILPYYSIGRFAFIHSILSRNILLNVKKKLKSIKGFQPNVIHAHYLFPDGYLAKYLAKVLNLSYLLTLQDETRFILNRYAFNQARIVLNEASAVTTLSTKMKIVLEERGYSGIQILTLGIDDSFFKQIKQVRSDKFLRFVTAAQLVPIKNLDSVIRAMVLLRNHEGITYTIIGDGPEKIKLTKLTRDLDMVSKINFLPQVPNKMLAKELVKYDVYVQPSFKETLGLSYFEALACGLPVIISKNTGTFDLIKGRNVYLTVNPYDVNDIAEKMESCCNTEFLNELCSSCKETSEIATWDNTTEFLHKIYEQ